MSYSFTIPVQSAGAWPAPPVDPLLRGMELQRAGHLDKAWDAYLEALRQRPRRALGYYALGLLQIARGMGLSSIPFLLHAAALQPRDARYAEAVLYARLRAGRLDVCQALLEQHAQDDMDIDVDQWRGWLQQCREGASAAELQLPAPMLPEPQAIAEPDDPSQGLATQSPAHPHLAAPFARVLRQHEENQHQAMVDDLAPLLERYPDWGEGLHMHGIGLHYLGRREPAANALRRAASLLPGRSEVWDHLGIVLGGLEDDEGVVDAYERSLSVNPLRLESWNNAADAAIRRQYFAEGYQYAWLALRLDTQGQGRQQLFNVGRAALGLGDLTRARRALEAALQADPNFAEAEMELGKLWLELGNESDALTHFNRALELDPRNHAALSGLIFLHNYLGSETQARIYQRARQYAALLLESASASASAAEQARQPWANTAGSEPERVLRVGVVSGDLRNHSVGLFFQTVAESLAGLDGLERFAYPTTIKADAVTARIRAGFDHWTPIARLTDDEAAQRIRADGIDILIDLSGHTGYHRLGVFARKPAPVQVTWLGYFGTTGLSQIDYLLAGPWDVPANEEADFSEAIWRLPHTRLCFSPPSAAVDVGPLPAIRNGHVTFACFSNLRKVTDRVLALWAQILAGSDDARLLLKNAQLDSEQVRQAVTRRFAALGIGPERLILQGPSGFETYLQTYNQVDIVLDTFPYTGGTTTAQSLWMGVPVLTRAGDRLLARQGEGMLRVLGLDDWVAPNDAGYVQRALQQAAYTQTLAALRAGLRERMAGSPLMDAPLFAADLAAALRGMWRRWCADAGRRGAV